MKVLMRSIILLLIFLSFSHAADEVSTKARKRVRRPKHELPLREYDRPLTLPQKNFQISAGYMAGFTWDKDSGIVDFQGQFIPDDSGYYSSPYHIDDKPNSLVPEITFAFNDSLQISTRFMMPTITYTFLNNSVKDENGIVSIVKPSIAVFAGLDYLSFNTYGSGVFEFSIAGGLKGKFPINNVLWSDASIKVTAGNSNVINVYYDAGFGIQLNDHLALKPKVNLRHYINYSHESTSFDPTFETEFDINFSRHFGIDIYGLISEAYKASIDCSFGATLNFNW